MKTRKIVFLILLGFFSAKMAHAQGDTGLIHWMLNQHGVLFAGAGDDDKIPEYFLSSPDFMGYVDGIYKYAFSESDLNSVATHGSTLATIGIGAFRFCHSLTSVNLPAWLEDVGDNAFRVCSQLTSIIIPASVTRIGNGAFADCDEMTSVTLPASVTYIGREAFSICSNLAKIINYNPDPLIIPSIANGDEFSSYFVVWNSSQPDVALIDETGKVSVITAFGCDAACTVTVIQPGKPIIKESPANDNAGDIRGNLCTTVMKTNAAKNEIMKGNNIEYEKIKFQ